MLRARAAEVVRYLLTGAISVALNLLIIVALTEGLGLNYLVSISVCFVTVTFVSFYLNRFWTFRKHERGVPRDLARFVLVTLTQLPVSLAVCSFGVEVLKLPYAVTIVLASMLFVPSTYLLHRCWSFGLRRKVPALDGQRE